MHSLVISIFLYGCESWTLTAKLEKRTQSFEMRCHRRLFNISYKDHFTNEEVYRKIQAAIGEYDELLALFFIWKITKGIFSQYVGGVMILLLCRSTDDALYLDQVS